MSEQDLLTDCLKDVTKERDELADALEQAQAEITGLEKKIYLDGHWSCPKCKFYLVSTSFYVGDGSMGPNTKPQQCANGCGPMWRVTHEQSANTMVDRCEAQTSRIEQLEGALQDLVTLKDYRDWHGKTPEYLKKKPAAWQQARDVLGSAGISDADDGCPGYLPNPDWMQDGNACGRCGCGPEAHDTVQDR